MSKSIRGNLISFQIAQGIHRRVAQEDPHDLWHLLRLILQKPEILAHLFAEVMPRSDITGFDFDRELDFHEIKIDSPAAIRCLEHILPFRYIGASDVEVLTEHF